MTVRQGGSYLKKSADAKPELVARTTGAVHPNDPVLAPPKAVAKPADVPVTTFTDERNALSSKSTSKTTPKAGAKEPS